jgi:hypothetical protein
MRETISKELSYSGKAYFAKTLNFRFAVALEHRNASRTRLPPESMAIWRI